MQPLPENAWRAIDSGLRPRPRTETEMRVILLKERFEKMTESEWRAFVEQRLSTLETEHAVSRERDGSISIRLAAIEDTLKWLTRLIMGALVLAAIGMIVPGLL